MLDVHKRPRMRKEDVDNHDAPKGDVKQGRLILVDLAGSEKVKKTASEGVRLTEVCPEDAPRMPPAEMDLRPIGQPPSPRHHWESVSSGLSSTAP